MQSPGSGSVHFGYIRSGSVGQSLILLRCRIIEQYIHTAELFVHQPLIGLMEPIIPIG